MVSPEIKRILHLQWQLVFVTYLISSLCGMSRSFMLSLVLGGAVGILPAIAYVIVAYTQRDATPERLIRGHFKAEAVKFLLTLVLFAGVVSVFKQVSAAGLFSGYLAVVAGYWVGLLIRR